MADSKDVTVSTGDPQPAQIGIMPVVLMTAIATLVVAVPATWVITKDATSYKFDWEVAGKYPPGPNWDNSSCFTWSTRAETRCMQKYAPFWGGMSFCTYFLDPATSAQAVAGCNDGTWRRDDYTHSGKMLQAGESMEALCEAALHGEYDCFVVRSSRARTAPAAPPRVRTTPLCPWKSYSVPANECHHCVHTAEVPVLPNVGLLRPKLSRSVRRVLQRKSRLRQAVLL